MTYKSWLYSTFCRKIRLELLCLVLRVIVHPKSLVTVIRWTVFARLIFFCRFASASVTWFPVRYLHKLEKELAIILFTHMSKRDRKNQNVSVSFLSRTEKKQIRRCTWNPGLPKRAGRKRTFSSWATASNKRLPYARANPVAVIFEILMPIQRNLGSAAVNVFWYKNRNAATAWVP